MKTYQSESGIKITWESNTMAMWQSCKLHKYGDQGNKNYVSLEIDLNAHSGKNHILAAENDYRVALRPVWTPRSETPYPCGLHAKMVYFRKPRGYGGRSAPDKILVWGLRGASAVTFIPVA